MDFLQMIKEVDKGSSAILKTEEETIRLYKNVNWEGEEYVARDYDNGFATYVPSLKEMLNTNWEILVGDEYDEDEYEEEEQEKKEND